MKKKKLSKEAKFNLKNGFGSLINNQCAIEAGKSLPWWSAIIVGLLAAFLPMIPIMVNIFNTNGSNYITTATTYSFERNLAITLTDLKEKKAHLDVDANHYLTYSLENEQGEKVPQTVTDPVIISKHINEQSHQYTIISYFLADYNNKTASDYYNDILNETYRVGTTDKKTSADPENSTYYTPTLMFFYKEGFAFSIKKINTTTSATSFAGDFTHVEPCDLVERLGNVQGMARPTNINEITTEYEQGVVENTKPFLDESFYENKNRSILYNLTIYYSVYVGLILFLGLLIFLLTRGKKNLNNYLRLHQCLRISAWAALAPGILSLLGFLMSSYAIMMFILFFGIRIMWLTMKQLSPVAAA